MPREPVEAPLVMDYEADDEIFQGVEPPEQEEADEEFEQFAPEDDFDANLQDQLNRVYTRPATFDLTALLSWNVLALRNSLKDRNGGQMGPDMRVYAANFGVEIEIEPVEPTDIFGALRAAKMPVSGWKSVHDGSLSVHGQEFVLKRPHSLRSLVPAIRILTQRLAERGITVDLGNYKPGVHIHYNIQRLPIWQVFGTVAVWAAVEPLVLRQLGPARNGNSFCISVHDTGDLPDCVTGWFSPWSHVYARERRPPIRGKYSSVNLDTIWTYGSLEFRVFPSTIDPLRIKSWCQWVENCVIEAGKAQGPAALPGLIQSIAADPERIVKAIFGKIPPELNQIAPELIAAAAEQAHEIALAVQQVATPLKGPYYEILD